MSIAPGRYAWDWVAWVAPPAPNAVYLDPLYREPDTPSELPFVSPELMSFFRAVKWSVLTFLAVVCWLVLIWMLLRPTTPLLNVAAASISNVNITAAAAAAECNITLLLTNPNRHLTATYERMDISLLYASQEVQLSQFHQPPIVQHRQTQLIFDTDLSFSGVNLGNGVVGAMKQDLDGGSLGLGIKMSSVVKYRSGIWKTKAHFMRAYCDGVSFTFSSSNKPGIFLNPYQECQVYVYSK